jgi:hypothetical protein
MDYKFKQSAVLVASLLVLLVLVFVLVSNKGTIKRKANAANKSAVSIETSVPEEKPVTSETFFKGKQVGNSLSAWKSDPLFFQNELNEKIHDPMSVDVSSNDTEPNKLTPGDADSSSQKDFEGKEVEEKKDEEKTPASDKDNDKKDKDKEKDDKETTGGHG